MRYTVFFAAAVLAISPVHAQELAVFETWALSGLPDSEVERGPGLSVTATGRLGGVMNRVERLRGSNLRVGARVSVSKFDSRMLDYSRCVDDCPSGSWDVPVPLHVWQGSLLAYPYRTVSTQLELAGGFAAYRYPDNARINAWGLTAGAGVSRRLLSGVPLWANLAYETHAPSFLPRTADHIDTAPPRHAFRLGMAYVLANR